MMPRKRKREWPIRVLVYRAYPREIPQAMWDTAKRQRILWNNLTELWYGAADQARLLPDRKEPIWQSFDEWCHAAVAQSALDWVNGPDVLDRFRAARRAKKFPRFHRGLDRVAIAHRFTAGGVPLDRLIDNRRTKRFSLRSSDDLGSSALYAFAGAKSIGGPILGLAATRLTARSYCIGHSPRGPF